VTTRSVSATAAVDQTAPVLRTAATEDLCRSSVGHLPGPDWIRQPFLSACERSHADQSRALGRSFIQNLGRAMFLFLPLLAAFMTPMYSRARRYYVDNLLLLVHNHAFVFLVMSIYLLALHWTHSGTLTTLLTLALICHVIFYSYRSMQRVYAETWLRTLVKFTAIALGWAAPYARCFLQGCTAQRRCKRGSGPRRSRAAPQQFTQYQGGSNALRTPPRLLRAGSIDRSPPSRAPRVTKIVRSA
jgi:hypothetical protein